MGDDKCFLTYHSKPQCYHVYDMLQQFCKRTFISCNDKQSKLIDKNYKTIEDAGNVQNNGPATGVLSAFSKHPHKDFLVIACDYPLLTGEEIKHFLESIPEQSTAAAFCDKQSYQPVLAWYSSKAGSILLQSSAISLSRLLQDLNAYKHYPKSELSITGIDTREASDEAMHLTNKNN